MFKKIKQKPSPRRLIQPWQKNQQLNKQTKQGNASQTLLNKTFAKTHRKMKQQLSKQIQMQQGQSKSARKLPDNKLQKLSLASLRFKKTQEINSVSKLTQILKLFSQKDSHRKNNKKWQQLFEKNQKYIDLLSLWQKEEIYDQSDKLVYKIIQSCLRTTQEIILQMNSQFQNKLASYEKMAEELCKQQENIRKEMRISQEKTWLMTQLFNQAKQNFQKNVWSTIVFQKLSKMSFNLQLFMKNIDIDYTRRQSTSKQTSLIEDLSQFTKKSSKINQNVFRPTHSQHQIDSLDVQSDTTQIYIGNRK